MDTEETVDEIIDSATRPLLVEMANVKSDKRRNTSVQVNLREGLNVDYFKFYNHQDFERADKVCRISMRSPKYIEHANVDGKKNWVLSSRERKMLMECMAERSSSNGWTLWEQLIIAFNKEKPGLQLDEDETVMNTMDNLVYPDHLPIDLPMPDYRLLRK